MSKRSADRRNARNAESGVSLVETLMALFVLAIAGAALVRMQSQSMATLSGVEHHAIGALVAQDALVASMADYAPPVAGASEGRVEMAGRAWSWRVQISATADPRVMRVEASAYAEGEMQAAASAIAYRRREGG